MRQQGSSQNIPHQTEGSPLAALHTGAAGQPPTTPELSEGRLHALPPQTASPLKLPRSGPSVRRHSLLHPGRRASHFLVDIEPAGMVSGSHEMLAGKI